MFNNHQLSFITYQCHPITTHQLYQWPLILRLRNYYHQRPIVIREMNLLKAFVSHWTESKPMNYCYSHHLSVNRYFYFNYVIRWVGLGIAKINCYPTLWRTNPVIIRTLMAKPIRDCYFKVTPHLNLNSNRCLSINFIIMDSIKNCHFKRDLIVPMGR